MKIPFCRVNNVSKEDEFRCPACHCSLCRKHGFYIRRGFHAPNCAVAIPVKIQRYLCRNPECKRCTFSVLPSLVLRYCRFLWPYLLGVNRDLSAGLTAYHLARHVWHVGREVIVRAATVYEKFEHWMSGQYQELTGSCPAICGLEWMLHCVTDTLGRFELARRWYRHRYPLRFC